MRLPRVIPFLVVVAWLAQPLAAGPLPRIVAHSETPRVVIAGAEVERLDTLDDAPVYRLKVQLAEPLTTLAGLNVEYDVYGDGGRPLGGGMFTIAPEMLAPGRDAFTAVTGFGGLELAATDLLLVRVTEPSWLSPAPAAASLKSDERLEAQGGKGRGDS